MTFNLRYFTITIVLFLIEMVIAFYVTQEFIRYTFGDFLAVILIYYFIKSLVKAKPIYIAISVIIISFGIEFLQLIDILEILNIKKNLFTKLVLGTTFSISDLIAYTLGVLAVFFIDTKKFS